MPKGNKRKREESSEEEEEETFTVGRCYDPATFLSLSGFSRTEVITKARVGAAVDADDPWVRPLVSTCDIVLTYVQEYRVKVRNNSACSEIS